MIYSEFNNRRDAFLKQIDDNSIVIIANHSEQIRNSDVFYPFRSNSDFFYLTGFDEPDAIVILIRQSHEKKPKKTLIFCREKNPKKELWDGETIGLQKAVDEYGIDEAYPLTEIETILPKLLTDKSHLFYHFGVHDFLDQYIPECLKTIKTREKFDTSAPTQIFSPEQILHEMRLFKSKEEIFNISQAIKATAKAHIRAMRTCKPSMMEYELEAELLYEFNKTGAKSPAYPSIVASGDNACTLHYTKNNQPLVDGKLVLIDAGSEFKCYAADVTRTFPINGQFSKPQREIYQLVLDAQTAAIKCAVPNNRWDDIHQAAIKTITQGLITLNILSGNLDELIQSKAYKTFFMHNTGHWLGMDVHDVGNYKITVNRSRLLMPRMVFTIEPGVYIPKNSNAPKEYRGIGIRIEDNILITKNGCQVLTNAIPKTIEEIEETMRDN